MAKKKELVLCPITVAYFSKALLKIQSASVFTTAAFFEAIAIKERDLTYNMDVLNDKLLSNGSQYKKALDRIIDTYSKPQYQDGGIEVEFNNTGIQNIQSYMSLSQDELHKLESQNLADLSEDSLRAQDNTRYSLLDLSCHDSEYGETSASNSQSFNEEDETARNDPTKLTVNSLQESGESFLELDLHPEDQDEELEMALRNHRTLVELYPSMISRIERAWHRQNVSEAADGVLRKYRKWRQHSNRSSESDTSVVSLQRSKQRRGPSRMPPLENMPERDTWAEYVPVSPLKTAHKLPDQQMGPKTEQHRPVLVTDAAVKRVYSSPVRPSPRMPTPRSLYRSHKEPREESFSGDTPRSPPLLTCLGSSLQRPPDNVYSPKVSARQPARAQGRIGIQRHLSFDSSQPSRSVFHSPEKLDEDLKKLYHKQICPVKKSFYDAPPCRFCAKHSAGSPSHSFRALAALALSPYRSHLRKRQRESGWDGNPPSKCSREEY